MDYISNKFGKSNFLSLYKIQICIDLFVLIGENENPLPLWKMSYRKIGLQGHAEMVMQWIE